VELFCQGRQSLFAMEMRTGYVFEELYLWHEAGSISFDQWTQHGEHWENPATKHRIHSLLEASGLTEAMRRIRARRVTDKEILTFHTPEYLEKLKQLDGSGGETGELARMGPGGLDIARLSAGGVLAALQEIHEGRIDNAFCLVRPPGHHAEPDKGMGFCILNNVAIAVKSAQKLGYKRVAVVDYDVHFGNGTALAALEEDSNMLFISLHQDGNYPLHQGGRLPDPEGQTTINIALPPGTGIGGYKYAFDTVVVPALSNFDPDFIFVSSGFDGGFCDPLARMMLDSVSFGSFALTLKKVAEACCKGKILFAHEGGYSKEHVPFCALAVVESLTGKKAETVKDTYNPLANAWNYQHAQPAQVRVVNEVAKQLELPIQLAHLGKENTSLVERVKDLLNGLEDSQKLQVLAEFPINF